MEGWRGGRRPGRIEDTSSSEGVIPTAKKGWDGMVLANIRKGISCMI